MYSLFPIPVKHYENFLSNEEAKTIFEFCKRTKSDPHSSFLGSATSSHDNNKNIFYDLDNVVSNIENRLETFLDNYATDTGFKKQKIVNSWFNIQQKGSLLKTHLHASAVLSGTIYINVDNNSSKLYFENPNKFIKYFENTFDSLTQYNYEYFYITPKIGDLIIFPSWLEHGSNGEQNTTDDRIVISFNTELR